LFSLGIPENYLFFHVEKSMKPQCDDWAALGRAMPLKKMHIVVLLNCEHGE